MNSGERVPIWHHTVFFIAIGLGAMILAILYGFGPGLLPSAAMNQFFLGLARCYAEHLPSIHCDAVAQPVGYTTVFGLPYVLPTAVLDRMGIPLLYAGRIVEFLYLALALGACIALFRSFQIRLSIALLTGFIFLASPIVFAQDAYGPLRLGFALVPFYALVDLVLARRIIDIKRLEKLIPFSVLAFVALVFIRCLALFLDGYSFVMGLVLSTAVLSPLVLRSDIGSKWVRLVLIGINFSFSTVLAYLIYTEYVGGMVEGTVMPIDFFRGQGVDLYVLIVPSVMQWFAEWFNIHHSITGWMSYSDGASVAYVYMGWSLIILFAVGFFVLFSRRVTAEIRSRLVVFMLLVVGSLYLALGPSLKFADFRIEPRPERFIEFSDYLMPESEASLSLGTDWLYQQVPGVRNMRAVYRWMLLVKLSALMVAALVLEHLMRQRRLRAVSGFFLVFIILELLPDVPQRLEHGQHQYVQYKAFENEVLKSLLELNLKDKTVLLMPTDTDEEWNHFSANFLCPMAELNCFNLGGDKSLLQAKSTWPLALRELSRGRWIIGNLQSLHLGEEVDEILIPLFSLRMAAEQWPPSSLSVERTLVAARSLVASAGVIATRHGWFLRLSKDTLDTDRQPLQIHSETKLKIESWGPTQGSFYEGFNVQADGRSSFWVLFPEDSGPNERMVLSLNGYELETYNDARVLSGRLFNPSDKQKFPAGVYDLEVRDRLIGNTTLIGEFTVIDP